MTQTYRFQHENGAKVRFRAKSEEDARRQLRDFVQNKMFGAFALFYEPEAVERELAKIHLVEQ